jgi:predicted RNA binding protein YcfA (HicA-like mRNA interferase family)
VKTIVEMSETDKVNEMHQSGFLPMLIKGSHPSPSNIRGLYDS